MATMLPSHRLENAVGTDQGVDLRLGEREIQTVKDLLAVDLENQTRSRQQRHRRRSLRSLLSPLYRTCGMNLGASLSRKGPYSFILAAVATTCCFVHFRR